MGKSKPENARRREFGACLKSRRERLQPQEVGLRNGFRRRTPGLRRDKVALLADTGTTWYTWLEQGREVRPSRAVRLSIASALKLDEAGRRYLFDLAGLSMREVNQPGQPQPAAAMLRMPERAVNQPAYLLGPCWDILAWNQAACALFGDYSR